MKEQVCPICKQSRDVLVLENGLGWICAYCQIAEIAVLPPREKVERLRPQARNEGVRQ